MMPLRFKPNIEKIIELLLYLSAIRPGADKYQAVKFFYLADREHLNRYGRPITYDNYFALWYGPVASNTLDILNADDARELKLFGVDDLPFETRKGKTPTGKDTTFIIGPKREFNRQLFSKSDLKVFDEIIARYKDASFDDLFKLTHDHFAYLNAWENRRFGNRAEMYYDEMIDDEVRRAELVEDLAPVASYMQ